MLLLCIQRCAGRVIQNGSAVRTQRLHGANTVSHMYLSAPVTSSRAFPLSYKFCDFFGQPQRLAVNLNSSKSIYEGSMMSIRATPQLLSKYLGANKHSYVHSYVARSSLLISSSKSYFFPPSVLGLC